MSNGKSPIDPSRLTIEQASKLLSAAAKIRISEDLIAEDLASGAPQNKDGTISLVTYGAWLLKEMSRGE